MPTIISTQPIQNVCEKSQKWITSGLHILYRLDKFKIFFQGYNRIQPTIYARGIGTMFSKSFCMTEDSEQHFIPCLKPRSKTISKEKSNPQIEAVNCKILQESCIIEETDSEQPEKSPEKVPNKFLFRNTTKIWSS